MAAVRIKALAQTIARHPWSSLQDGLLLAMAMIVAILLALEHDLFSFIAELSEPQRKISLAEAILLTVLLALCIVAFVMRRLHEERREVASQATTKVRLREFRRQASRDSLTDLANRRLMLKALKAVTADRDTALAIARRLIASLKGEIRAGVHSYKIGASIGAVLIPDDGKKAEEIIHHADLAMYRAKGQDQSSVVFFEPTATYPQQIVN